MPRGHHPHSKANLRKGSGSPKKRARKPRTNSPAHMQMMNARRRELAERRRRQAMIESEFPIVTPRERPAEDVPDAAPAETGAIEEPRAIEKPVVKPVAIDKPVEETDGERRARLYKRDYALLMSGNWRELNRLRAEESSTFRRVQGHGRIDWAALSL